MAYKVLMKGCLAAAGVLCGLVVVGVAGIVVVVMSKGWYGDVSLTALDEWNKAQHVLVVQGGAVRHGLVRVRVKDVLKTGVPALRRGEWFYTGPGAGMAPGDHYLGTFAGVSDRRNRHLVADESLRLIDEEDGRGNVSRYAHPWHRGVRLEREGGEWIIRGCVDGLTRAPMQDPSVKTVVKLAGAVLNGPGQVEDMGLLWPAEGSLNPYRRCSVPLYE